MVRYRTVRPTDRQPTNSKMQIISSFRPRFGLVTTSIHYYPTSKWLTLSSAALELASICLTAVINCTNNRSSIDVFFATAIDMFCCVLHFVFHIFLFVYHTYYLIWFDIIFSTIIGRRRLSVLINDILCYIYYVIMLHPMGAEAKPKCITSQRVSYCCIMPRSCHSCENYKVCPSVLEQLSNTLLLSFRQERTSNQMC